MPRRASRWRKWYLWSIALVLGGACFSPLMMSRKLLVLATPRRATIIQAPGEGEIRVAVPGEFVVCHEQRGFPISGYHSENRALSPRTTSVDVRETGSETPIVVSQEADVHALYGIVARHLVGSFRAERPGTYRVRITPADGRPATMSVAPMPKDDIATVAGMAIVATAIGTLAFLVGIGLLVVTAVRHAIAAIRSRRTVSK